jgi:transaldolase
MYLFLDSAIISEARQATQLGWVHGVTTNPTLLAQSELPPEETLRQLAAIIDGEVFYQLMAADVDGMLAEGHAALHLLGYQGVIKIPATQDGFQAAARLAETAHVAITAIFSPAQAAVAAAVGARYAIVYVNRAARLLSDGAALVRGMAEALSGSQTEILAASIKSPEEAAAALNAGAHHLTLPLSMLLAMAQHPLSDQSVAEFAAKGAGIHVHG